MNFMFYDLGLLVVFAVFVSIFLYTGRKNLKKDGLLLLYRTSWGIKLINYVGKKYSRTLKVLSYVSIGLGYCLMVGMIYFFYTIVKIYIFRPDVVTAVKVPPIMPLIPYLPQVFKLDFLPPFYFIYWILILAVIAISHEFAHGIFAAYNKVRIKKTGFGFFPFFLPVFLAAFVELDEEQMAKKSKFSQRAVLSAGTFANVLTAILGFVVLWIFFSISFAPAGVTFDTYPYAVVGVANISMINEIQINNPSYEEAINLLNDEGLNEFEIFGEKFVGEKNFIESQKNEEYFLLYFDSPAIRNGLDGAILKIDGVETKSVEVLREELGEKSPGQNIEIIAFDGEKNVEYKIELGGSPSGDGSAWLGVGFLNNQREGIVGKIHSWLSSFKEKNVYYSSNIGNLGIFIYNLLWWIVLISVSVALVNMLPVGIFDGGRFFYLTIWGITGKESWAKKSFRFVTFLFLFLLLVLMFFWVLSFF